jgi:hypothetical protein
MKRDIGLKTYPFKYFVELFDYNYLLLLPDIYCINIRTKGLCLKHQSFPCIFQVFGSKAFCHNDKYCIQYIARI